MSRTLFSRPSAIACTVVVCVVAAVAIGTGAWPESSLAEEKLDDKLTARQSKQETQAIESYVDVLLLASDEQTVKERFKVRSAEDLAAVQAEIEGLERDLTGIRQVTREQFVALTRRMEIIPSSVSIVPIGVTRDRAYLEVSVDLTSQYRYVAIVSTELAGLPDEAANKLKDARDKAAFQVRVRAISAKLRKAVHEYERGDHNSVVRLLEGLDEEIDALSVLHPTRESKWMPGVKKTIVYCLLAASYGKQNEPEKSAKYEALFKETCKATGKEVNVESFLRSIRLELDLSDPLDAFDERKRMMLEEVPPGDKDK